MAVFQGALPPCGCYRLSWRPGAPRAAKAPSGVMQVITFTGDSSPGSVMTHIIPGRVIPPRGVAPPSHICPICSVVSPCDPGAARRDVCKSSRFQGTRRTHVPFSLPVPCERGRSGERGGRLRVGSRSFRQPPLLHQEVAMVTGGGVERADDGSSALVAAMRTEQAERVAVATGHERIGGRVQRSRLSRLGRRRPATIVPCCSRRRQSSSR
jgi:hypothetical protein